MPSIIQIGDCLVSTEIFTEYFSCDYGVCKGVCCVIGDSGAPLEDSEPGDLERNYRFYSGLILYRGKMLDVGTRGLPQACLLLALSHKNYETRQRSAGPEPAPVGYLQMRLRKGQTREYTCLRVPQRASDPSFR